MIVPATSHLPRYRHRPCTAIRSHARALPCPVHRLIAARPTCTHAPADDYDGLRDLLADSAGAALPLSEVLGALGGERRAAIMTDKFCRLAEITTCYAKRPDGTVGERVDCPAHVLGSTRNSAVLDGCHQVHLDESGSCSFISKELLRSLKAASDCT